MMCNMYPQVLSVSCLWRNMRIEEHKPNDKRDFHVLQQKLLALANFYLL